MHSNKIIVAPMVRVSTLPFRLLCLDYGADIVYTEETIDFKMLRSIKYENEVLGTTDFVDRTDGTVFFRTCNREKDKLIFQIGTCHPERALRVAKLVEDYVAGIDINMGCPKEFSLKGGMGAALLTQPEKVKEILSTLTKNLSIPVTCKIRILTSFEETLSLCKLIESCGVAAVAIHGRTKDERPNHANHNDVIRRIANELSIPVIANGGSKEIESVDDVEKFRSITGAASVMVGRAAMWNCSVFRKEGKKSIDTVIQEYLKYCIQYDNPFTFTKYTVQNMLRDMQSSEKGKAFLETQTLQEMCVIWRLNDYFNECLLSRKESESKTRLNSRSIAPLSIENIPITEKTENDFRVLEMPLQFIRGNFASADLPKMILNTYLYRNGFKKAIYIGEAVDKFFISSVEVDGIKYRSSVKEKSRRYSEQGAALVYLHVRGIVNKSYGFVASAGTRKYAKFNSSNIPTAENHTKDDKNHTKAEKRSNKLSESVSKSMKLSDIES